MLVGAVFA